MLPEAIAEQERLGLGAPRGARANGHVVDAVWRRFGLLGSGLAREVLVPWLFFVASFGLMTPGRSRARELALHCIALHGAAEPGAAEGFEPIASRFPRGRGAFGSESHSWKPLLLFCVFIFVSVSLSKSPLRTSPRSPTWHTARCCRIPTWWAARYHVQQVQLVTGTDISGSHFLCACAQLPEVLTKFSQFSCRVGAVNGVAAI